MPVTGVDCFRLQFLCLNSLKDAPMQGKNRYRRKSGFRVVVVEWMVVVGVCGR